MHESPPFDGDILIGLGGRIGAAVAFGAAATFHRLVIDDSPAAIELEVAALTEKYLKLPSASLYP